MSSLPALLAQRVHANGGRVALAFKERGAWHAFTWAGVERKVWHLASALTQRGFGADSRLLITGQSNAHEVLATLAALSLGGGVASAQELSEQSGSAVVNASDLTSNEASTAGAQSQERTRDRCLSELDVSVHANAVLLLTSWLEQGFELGIPEEMQSAARDARELGVGVRVASPATWDIWAEAVRSRFAAPGSLRRRLVDWALRVNGQAPPVTGWSRWLAAVSVIRPLRRALGVSRWHRAVAFGGAPQSTTALLLAGLGVRIDDTLNPDQQTALDAPLPLVTPPSNTTAAVTELVRQSA